ncbi:MAG: phosphatase PAP2 family protein [Paludibacteraceae bacterium]|nr:phosphatase PAP2 family protein [Paludibacteraceae bacterium]
MKQLIKQNAIFLSISIVALFSLGITILLTDKAQLHLFLNSCHFTIADFFFRYYTLIGEFAIYLLALYLLIRRQYFNTLFVLLSEGLSAAIIQLIKHLVNMPRPKIFFDIANNPDILPLVSGVKLHSWHSFPSGHTASFAVLCFCICILVCSKYKNNRLISLTTQITCAICFLLGGYSRIYLSQHFAQDIFVGGIIGLASVLIIYAIFLYLKKSLLDTMHQSNTSKSA